LSRLALENLSQILFVALTSCGSVAQEVPKVIVQANLQSGCPCAPQWETDFQNFVMPAVGDIVELRRYWDGTAKEDGSVECFHGDGECVVNTYEECARVQATSWQQSLAYSTCWNNCTKGFDKSHPGRTCSGQYNFFLQNTDLAQSCAGQHGLDWDAIAACAKDADVGGKLLWNSTSMAAALGLTPYNVKGTPTVAVNGKVESTTLDCNSDGQGHIKLIKLICEAYTGTTPAGCEQLVAV